MKQAIVLEEEQVVFFFRTHPNVFGLDDSRLEVVQKLPCFAQVINNFRRVIGAMADEQSAGQVLLHLKRLFACDGVDPDQWVLLLH